MQIFNQRTIPSVQWGAIGFGVGFALFGVVMGAMSRSIFNFNTGLQLGTLLYALAGGFGGALLGAASKSQSAVWRFALAGLVGCGAGFFGTTLTLSYLDLWISGYLNIIAQTTQYIVIGAGVGALLGGVQKNWKLAGRLTLTGAISFGFGFLVQGAVLIAMGRLIDNLVPGASGELTHDRLTTAIMFGLSSAIIGICGGAALGLALGHHQADTILPPSAGTRAEGKTALT